MMRVIVLVFAAALVGIDQLIKLRVLDGLAAVGQIEVVPGFFYLTYVENRGAAFGIMQNSTTLLSVITSIVLLAAVFFILSGKVNNKFLLWSLSLVVAGGAGNLIDRIYRGFVVDYLDFSALFGFPVFNFADCCVVIGTILMLCCIVWMDKDAAKRAGRDPSHEPETEQ